MCLFVSLGEKKAPPFLLKMCSAQISCLVHLCAVVDPISSALAVGSKPGFLDGLAHRGFIFVVVDNLAFADFYLGGGGGKEGNIIWKVRSMNLSDNGSVQLFTVEDVQFLNGLLE